MVPCLAVLGAAAQSGLQAISQDIIGDVRNKDVGKAGDTLREMVSSLRGFSTTELDPNRTPSWWEKLLGKAKPAAEFMARYEQVRDQIDRITGDNLGDGEFGNEDDIDDNEQGDEAANNPINPPQPLFDTRPLIPGGDVNDPVSGTGNPALLGSDQQCEEDEQGQCPANPVKGDSQ